MTSEMSNRKKRLTGLAALSLSVVLLVAGTFAWFRTIQAVNEFRSDQVKSVVLHDDYDSELTDEVNSDAENYQYNKDIYVENSGTVDLYVRIRMDEYMEIYGDSLVRGAEREDRTTWLTHRYAGTAPEDCDTVFHDYWEWELAAGSVITEYNPAPPTARNDVVRRYDGKNDLLDRTDLQTTLPGNVLLMSSWHTLAAPEEYTGWILDTDGYAYWSRKLSPGTATGLLLDSVTLLEPDLLDESFYDFYYGINVVLEAVDEEDLEAWLEGTMPQRPVSGADAYEPQKATDEAASFLRTLATQ